MRFKSRPVPSRRQHPGLTSVTVQDPMITDDPQPFGCGLIHGGVWDNARLPTPLLYNKTDHTLKCSTKTGHSIARILPAHPAPGPTIDFAYIAPYAHSIPKSPKRIARNLSNAHCAQYAKQPIARYMHFGQNNIARNAQNAYSAVYAFWPKIHCAVYAFWPKTHCAQSAKPTKNTSQARNMHLFMSTIVIVGPAAAYATFVISCILRAMRT